MVALLVLAGLVVVPDPMPRHPDEATFRERVLIVDHFLFNSWPVWDNPEGVINTLCCTN